MRVDNLYKEEADNPEPLYVYTEEEMDIYEKFIEENFGEFESVFHEIYSPDIHLDIIIVPPTEENNYYKLITMGMGAYEMSVPSELKEYNLERAELVLYLPPTWNINSGKEEDYWPIRCLKSLARLPVEDDTWLACRHTISSDRDNTPYADNTKFCSILLLMALNKEFKVPRLQLGEKGEINFYQLFPLYEEELEYIFENGVDELFELFNDEDLMPILNIHRENCCGKNYLGKMLDDGLTHSNKITEKNLSADKLSGYNHLAVFFRWCVEHNLLSDRILSEIPEVVSIVKENKIDLREFILNNPLLDGKIRKGFFNGTGGDFATSFYVFNNNGYPSCVDAFAEDYFGTEKYNCEEFQDEAYLFVPYNEDYYKGLSKYIDKAWDEFLSKIFDAFK